MKLKNDKVFLRYIKESDIENYIKWTTVETEWQNWDAPWEQDENDDSFLIRQKEAVKETPQDYGKLEIENISGEHIGWVSTYYIDEDKEKLAVGIDIIPLSDRGKGYGKAALSLFMKYLFESRDVLYTQTWSGNLPMIALAKKLGFAEVGRIKDLREVNGKRYDALTFAITKEEFLKLYEANTLRENEND